METAPLRTCTANDSIVQTATQEPSTGSQRWSCGSKNESRARKRSSGVPLVRRSMSP